MHSTDDDSTLSTLHGTQGTAAASSGDSDEISHGDRIASVVLYSARVSPGYIRNQCDLLRPSSRQSVLLQPRVSSRRRVVALIGAMAKGITSFRKSCLVRAVTVFHRNVRTSVRRLWILCRSPVGGVHFCTRWSGRHLTFRQKNLRTV